MSSSSSNPNAPTAALLSVSLASVSLIHLVTYEQLNKTILRGFLASQLSIRVQSMNVRLRTFALW